MSFLSPDALILIATTLYQAIACWQEDRRFPPPGQFVDVGDCRLHYVVAGEGSPTIVLDHSLGGVEGYFLLDDLVKLSRVCIYDRAGFGWSDRSPRPRTSDEIVKEFSTMLIRAGLEPPYLLIGDSFGSYNMRLYAHRFPENVVGLVLTDGLHEAAMLKMPIRLKYLQFFFASGFVMSFWGSFMGIVRLLKVLKVFELLKPELRKMPPQALQAVKRSFCRPKHWLTMLQEISAIDSSSSRNLECADDLGDLPIVSIKARSFFLPSWWTVLLPLKQTNQLREQMHEALMKLSTRCIQLHADQSGHFVWVDQPEKIIQAVELLLQELER